MTLSAMTLDEHAADVLLTEDERALRDEVRAVVTAEVAPRAAGWDASGEFAHDSYQALATAGLGGLMFPSALGGREASTVAYALAMEEIAAACGATSLIYMTQMHAGYPIMLAGSEELARRYVPGLCSGELYGSLAITEPNAGSDVSALRTSAQRDGEHYVIDGAKTFITTGDRADVIVCFATVDRAAGRSGITAFAVDGSTPGLGRGRTLGKMGMHGSSTAELFFDGVRVPAAARLGEEGSGWRVVMSSVVKSRISAAAQGVGLARGAYEHTLAALRARGGPIPPDAAFTLAGLRTDILAGRLLLLATARAVDTDADTGTADVAMMKLGCTDLGWRTALACTDVLGADGDLAELGVERYLRDAKVTQIYDGTNEVQRLLIARDTDRRGATT
ncbi:acyl-CoA dehydrogenase family protein [Pseudonocardia acaciae]|uniref:acyl-CoA dehydrogenase family protein n=1 Tax=Pseudonocardia acaciae TaxID=551276 RepID=UPI000A006CCE|nr:acyl-CoA dehydrogenase family protein [Pseudonocardia acaciae]